MTELERLTPRDQRILKHIRSISEAGGDIQKFVDALQDVRDDPALTSAHREAIYKTLAQDAAQAYYVFTTGKPLDMEELLGEPPELPKAKS